jgi:hypothetical protein
MNVTVRYEIGGPGATGRLLLLADRGLAVHVPITVVAVDDPGIPYDVTAVLDADDDVGKVVCVDLHVARRPGGPEVTHDVLKRFPMRKMIEAAVVKAAPWEYDPNTGSIRYAQDAGRLDDAARDVVRPRPRGGYPAIPDSQLPEVAAYYQELKRKKRRDTNMAIAKRFRVSRSTAARAVERAREAGLHLPGRREEL